MITEPGPPLAAGTPQLLFYPDLCVGCNLCSYACSMNKFGIASRKKTAIRIVKDEGLKLEYPAFCVQCDERPCVTSCPTEALEWDASLGIVKLIDEKCIHCGICALECPYEVIAFEDRDIVKCDLCLGQPQCTQFCPTDAIVFRPATQGDIDGRVASAQGLLPVTKRHLEMTKQKVAAEIKKNPAKRGPLSKR
ncbi:MAG: 4Fe-4S dicluster domain-containing protein [Methanobacteriota archaeon]